MLEFERRSPASVQNPDADSDVLFLDLDGVFHTKASDGTLTVLGRGIQSIVKIGTVDLVDTYRITFSGGDTQDYTVTNGRGIASLIKLSTSGLVDTYRITYNDGGTFDFTVTNARSIVDVVPPANPGQPGATDTYTIQFNDGPAETFTVYNGTDGQDGLVLSVNGISQPNIVLTAADVGAIPATEKGAANGVATLDGAGKVPAGQLPSFVDDVLEFANLAAFPATGESGKIYVALDTGFIYRWSGSVYVNIATQPAFAAITGNTGTANADTSNDTIAITGSNGISTAATDSPDGIVISPAYGSPTGLAPDGANAAGTANTFARSDHVHATPTDTAVGLNGGSTNTEGTSTSFARADHTHAIANGGTPSTITPDAAANQGASTSLARSDHTHAIAADVPVALGASAAEGTSSAFARADHVHVNPVIAHEAAADPHPQYTTTAEAAAAAPVQSVAAGTGISVNSTTGNVTVTNAGVTSISVNGGAAQTGAVSIQTGKNFTTTTNLTAATPATITHNLALTNKDTFTYRLADSAGQTVFADVTSVNTNSLTITSAIAVTGLVVVIMGF